jgi:hypothetical protein
MKYVYPRTLPWLAVYDSLKAAWEASESNTVPPPFPLTLSDWVYSSDWDKHIRWLDTIEWADKHNLSHIIQELMEEDDKYVVKEFKSIWDSLRE